MVPGHTSLSGRWISMTTGSSPDRRYDIFLNSFAFLHLEYIYSCYWFDCYWFDYSVCATGERVPEERI